MSKGLHAFLFIVMLVLLFMSIGLIIVAACKGMAGIMVWNIFNVLLCSVTLAMLREIKPS